MGQHRAAQAVHERIRRSIEQTSRAVEHAVVRVAPPRPPAEQTPFQAELFEASHALVEGDELHLSDGLRWYHANYGIRVGDALAVVRLSNDEWFAFDVRSSRDDVAAGVRPQMAAANYQTGFGHVVGKMDVYDGQGNKLGVALVFDEATLATASLHGTDSAGDTVTVGP